jgi:SRSO17 transposase
LERYTTGLLTELPNKNGETIAQAAPGTSAQRLQEFLTNMPWDEEDLNRWRVQKMIADATTGDGVLVFDDTGFPKQGRASVGVAQQEYCWSHLPPEAHRRQDKRGFPLIA